jgi:hypothetical protein
MAMKNFKGQKNFAKKAPPSALQSLYGRQQVVKQLQKDRLWNLIIYGSFLLIGVIVGAIIGHIPGALIGAIVFYQLAKVTIKILKSKVKYFKKIYKKKF